MPVSDLGGWTLSPSQPCFQLYGTKRKNTDKEDQMTVQPNPLVFPFAKRKCFQPAAQEQQHTHQNLNQNQFLRLENTKNFEHVSGSLQLENTKNFEHGNGSLQQQTQVVESNEMNVEMMESDVQMEETSVQDQQICRQQQQIKSQEFRKQRELLIKRTEKLEEQLKFIQEGVESNDYWAAPSDSQLTMQDEIEQARIQMESDFAPDPYQYSNAGPDTLPMMGYDIRSKVRCYCKPTWEGVMNQNCFI